MSENTYKHLDLSKLSYRKYQTISTSELLEDITPIQWSEDVLNGEKKVIIDKYGIHEVSPS